MEIPKNKEDMMSHAQHIWAMLDNMAETDPAAYKRFIDKQISEGKEAKKPPQPHMCVLTTIQEKSNKRSLYLNIVSWQRIPPPKSDEDPIPVMGGNMYDFDKNGDECKCLTIAFNPKVLEDFGLESKRPQEQDMLIGLAMQYVRDQYKLKLSSTFATMPKSKRHESDLKDVVISLTSKFKKDGTEDDFGNEEEIKFTNEEMSLFNKLSNITPNKKPSRENDVQNQIKILPEEKATNKNLIQEISPERSSVVVPEFKVQEVKDSEGHIEKLVLKIKLDGVYSVAECDLQISENDLQLEVIEMYKLSLNLPCKVDTDEVKAKFSKKSSTLHITLNSVQR